MSNEKMSSERLMVGLSFTKNSSILAQQDERALGQAMWYAALRQVPLHIFHAIDIDGSKEPFEPMVDARRSEVMEVLDKLSEQGKSQGLEITTGVGVGEPWIEILREAWRIDASMIVVGPRVHDLGLMDRIFHGSTARRLIRKSNVPVWIVSPQGQLGVKRVLAPVDLKPVSENIVDFANQLHQHAQAKCTLLHCLDYPADLALRRLADDNEQVHQYHEAVEREAREDITELLGDSKEDWSVKLAPGPVAERVPQLCKEKDCDLVLIGGVGLPGIAGKLLGSRAEKVLERVLVSTIVFKPVGWRSMFDKDRE